MYDDDDDYDDAEEGGAMLGDDERASVFPGSTFRDLDVPGGGGAMRGGRLSPTHPLGADQVAEVLYQQRQYSRGDRS